MLLGLPSCCSSPKIISTPIEPCKVGPFPVLTIAPWTTCEDAVCLPTASAVALAKWFTEVYEYRLAVERCPYVTADAP